MAYDGAKKLSDLQSVITIDGGVVSQTSSLLPTFGVTIDSISKPTGGNPVDVNYTVENNESSDLTRTINLLIDGSVVSSEDISLTGGSSTTSTLSWSSYPDSESSYSVTIESDEDSDSKSIELKDNFNVSPTTSLSDEPANTTIQYNWNASNSGAVSGTQTLTATALANGGDDEFYSNEHTIGSGDSISLSAEWTPTVEDEGDATIELDSSGGDFDDRYLDNFDVVVPQFDVTIDGTSPSTVDTNDTLEVDYTVTNNGSLTAKRDIVFTIASTTKRRTDQELDPGQSYSGTFLWDPSNAGAGTYTAEIDVTTDTASTQVDVLTDFGVTIDGTNSAVGLDDTLEVDYTVTNNANSTDTRDIVFTIASTTKTRSDQELDPGQSYSGIFLWDSSNAGEGTYTAEIDVTTETASAQVDVMPYFATKVIATNSPVVVNNDMRGAYHSRNESNQTASRTQTVSTEGTPDSTYSATYDPGDDANHIKTEATSDDPNSGNVGTGTYTTTTDVKTDTDSTDIDVVSSKPDDLIIDSISTNSPPGSGVSDGETVEVYYDITNNSSQTITRTITSAVEDETIPKSKNAEYTWDPGETYSLTLVWSGTSGMADTYIGWVDTGSDQDFVEIIVN